MKLSKAQQRAVDYAKHLKTKNKGAYKMKWCKTETFTTKSKDGRFVIRNSATGTYTIYVDGKLLKDGRVPMGFGRMKYAKAYCESIA